MIGLAVLLFSTRDRPLSIQPAPDPTPRASIEEESRMASLVTLSYYLQLHNPEVKAVIRADILDLLVVGPHSCYSIVNRRTGPSEVVTRFC